MRVRLEEAVAEASLAEKFLSEGLTRNAAGKAFQGWKAVLAAAAALNRDAVLSKFPGRILDRVGGVTLRGDVTIALMPTGKMRSVAEVLVPVYGWEVLYLTDLALSLRESQYNGLDPEGVVSRYADLAEVEADVRHLVEKIREWVAKLHG